jgi:large subunit ribosomal protein L19
MNQFIFKDQKISTGDRVVVSLRIEEEGKSRSQNFEGIVIAIKGSGSNQTFTVRRIGAASIGVERILPVQSPYINRITIKSRGQTRRSKLYYLRDRVGRRALRVKEQSDIVKPVAKAADVKPKTKGASSRKLSQKTPAK